MKGKKGKDGKEGMEQEEGDAEWKEGRKGTRFSTGTCFPPLFSPDCILRGTDSSLYLELKGQGRTSLKCHHRKTRSYQVPSITHQ